MRVLGVDVGRRRIGLALSDESALIASPWKAVAARESPAATAAELAALIAAARAGLDVHEGIGAIVVGLPRRLGGEDTDQSAGARALAAALGTLTGLVVHLQDERLTSREAESRLARRERDWRRRKPLIDAMAAAIILQDFLDGGPRPGPSSAGGPP